MKWMRGNVLPRFPGIAGYPNLPITARHGAKMSPDILGLLHILPLAAAKVNLSKSGRGLEKTVLIVAHRRAISPVQMSNAL